MSYSIGEFSKITEISIHTLRYYEKEKLIIPERNSSGRRVYSEKDINWICFIKRLKETNMPIKEIRKYSVLREKGESTINERMEMLIEHRKKLEVEIESWNKHLDNLDRKIKIYKKKVIG